MGTGRESGWMKGEYSKIQCYENMVMCWAVRHHLFIVLKVCTTAKGD